MFALCVAAAMALWGCGMLLVEAKTKTNWTTYEVKGNSSASPFKPVRQPPSSYG